MAFVITRYHLRTQPGDDKIIFSVSFGLAPRDIQTRQILEAIACAAGPAAAYSKLPRNSVYLDTGMSASDVVFYPCKRGWSTDPPLPSQHFQWRLLHRNSMHHSGPSRSSLDRCLPAARKRRSAAALNVAAAPPSERAVAWLSGTPRTYNM